MKCLEQNVWLVMFNMSHLDCDEKKISGKSVTYISPKETCTYPYTVSVVSEWRYGNIGHCALVIQG